MQNFKEDFPALNASTNAKLHLLWSACGDNDVWTSLNREFNKWLDSKGVGQTGIETPGAHNLDGIAAKPGKQKRGIRA
jgi:hypothetical protein